MAGWARRAWAVAGNHPWLADGLVALVLLAAALLSISVQVDINQASDPSYRLPDGALVLFVTVVGTMSVAARRRVPLTVLCVTAAALVAARLIESPEDDIGFMAVLLAAYTAGANGATGRRAEVFATVAAVLGAELARPFLPELGERGAWLGLTFDLVFNLSILGVFWAFGVTTRARRENERELARRAEELERQREENARRAVFEERVRIARELHDVVAHHVSVMGIQAGAARRVMATQPDRAGKALGSIETASRQAVAELRSMLGFLRQEGEVEELGRQPSLHELDELVEQVAQAKLDVEVVVEGEPEKLAPTVELSAYRLVQEALTNTLKHARASRAVVRLQYGPEALAITVLDDGVGEAAVPPPGSGHGLIGMRERVGIHGGHLRAGPRDGGGFEVHATFPRATAEP